MQNNYKLGHRHTHIHIIQTIKKETIDWYPLPTLCSNNDAKKDKTVLISDGVVGFKILFSSSIFKILGFWSS